MTTVPPPSQQVVSALVVQQCVRFAKSRGIPTEQFLKGAGITREQLTQAHLQLPWLPVQEQLRLFLEQLDDPLVGLHISTLINVSTLGVWGYVVQTSTTLRNLIDTVVQFGMLLSNTGLNWQRPEGNALVWGWHCYMSDELVARHSMDCVIGCMASLITTLMRKQAVFPLLGVRLQHSAPRNPEHLREYEEFFRCPVQFNQKESGLLIAPEALEQTLTLADPALHNTLEEHARSMLNKRHGDTTVSLVDQVRAVVRAHLARHVAPSREAVAEEFGMSGRTLHRKLQDTGTSYTEILDELRFELAQDYLRASSLTVETIGQQLGFQESQSFIRWFRQLANTTPGEFRQQMIRMVDAK